MQAGRAKILANVFLIMRPLICIEICLKKMQNDVICNGQFIHKYDPGEAQHGIRTFYEVVMNGIIESVSKRIPRGLPRGKRAKMKWFVPLKD